MSRSLSEHHYDVPHLSAATMSPTPSVSTTSHESCVGGVDKCSENGSPDERSCVSSSSSDSAYNVASESVRLPKLESAGNVARAVVGARGALLVLPDSGVSMSVPEGAVPRNQRQRLHLAALDGKDRYRPRLPEGLSQLSAVVACGPTNASCFLEKPVILQFEHCAAATLPSSGTGAPHNWQVSVWASDELDEELEPLEGDSGRVSEGGIDEEDEEEDARSSHRCRWSKVLTLGDETINTPLFTQLDRAEAFIVTEQLRGYVLAGRTAPQAPAPACKRLRVVVFARHASQQQPQV